MDYIYTDLIKSDLYRHNGSRGSKKFLNYLLFNPGFKCTFLYRTCKYFKGRYAFFILYIFARWLFNHYSFKYGIHISLKSRIGKGLYIGHFGGINIERDVEIGNYCNISQNVTIGSMKTMSSEKYPRLGNSVYLAPGSKILGEIVIGDEVAIGANTVVTENIPDKAVFVGNPGKIVSYDGTKKLVTHILK